MSSCVTGPNAHSIPGQFNWRHTSLEPTALGQEDWSHWVQICGGPPVPQGKKAVIMTTPHICMSWGMYNVTIMVCIVRTEVMDWLPFLSQWQSRALSRNIKEHPICQNSVQLRKWVVKKGPLIGWIRIGWFQMYTQIPPFDTVLWILLLLFQSTPRVPPPLQLNYAETTICFLVCIGGNCTAQYTKWVFNMLVPMKIKLAPPHRGEVKNHIVYF